MNKIVRAFLAILLGCSAALASSTAQAVTHFQQYKSNFCTGDDFVCTIDFNTVAANRTLEVTNVSCYVRVSSSANLFAVQLFQMGPSGNIGTAVTLSMPFMASVPGFRIHQSNEQVLVRATAGQRFRVYAEQRSTASNSFIDQLACHISGRLLP
jgi:hypothetical protein